jgi:hypothetical protein
MGGSSLIPWITGSELGQGVMIQDGTTTTSHDHDSIFGWLDQDTYSCKLDLLQHFEEERSAVEIIQTAHNPSLRDRLLQGRHAWRWGRIRVVDNQLLEAGKEEGDLELTEEESSTSVTSSKEASEEGVIV